MKRRAPLLIAMATIAAAAVWLVTSELAIAARVWLVFLLAVLPFLLIVQAALLDSIDDVEPEALYLSSVASLWILGGATALVLMASGIEPRRIGLRPVPALAALAWAAGVTTAALLVLAGANRLGVRESPVLRRIIPRTRRQKIYFVGLSATAGFVEELVFRGFLIETLTAATGQLPIAVALSSIVFGLLHAYQRTAGAARAAVLGALLAAPLLVTGSLLPSIIAHTAIDIIAGIWLRDRLLA